MSKQSEAKKLQGYVPKPLARCCRKCNNLKVEEIHNPPPYERYYREKLTCGLGGFAVKAQAVCREFKAKEDTPCSGTTS